jgi:2-polyprenyl-3-methyl-5-hydroxy-6-metoxy-1,4-benzoquinol methylase
MTCYYCGSSDAEHIDTKLPLIMAGYETHSVALVRCKSCDLFYSTPLPERFDEVLHSFFQDSWETEHRLNFMDSWIAATWRPEPIWLKAARKGKRALGLSPAMGISRSGEGLGILLENKPKTLLDIGSGYGGFVRSARFAGIEAYGTDPNRELVRRLKAFGVDCISQGVFGANDGPLDRYDALTFLSVVDHFPYITPRFFNSCKGLLNPGGRSVVCEIDPTLQFVRDNETLRSPISFSYCTIDFMERASADAGLSYSNARCKSEPMYVFHIMGN